MKKFKLGANLGIIVLCLVMFLVSPQNLNPIYAEGAFIWLAVVTAFIVLNFASALQGMKLYQDERGVYKFDVDRKTKGFKKLVIILAILWGAYFLANVASSPLFNSKAYREQLGAPEITEFSSDIQPLDLSQVPIVDKNLAYSLADKKLGENPGMGSQVKLGEPVIQQVNDELVWIVPLEHSGFFKWLKNIDGSAGYIKVSATNLQDIEFVEAKIKYQPDAYFFDDVTRKVRILNGKVFDGLTDYSFEIDDQGTPYWILTTYKNNWLFALPEATGVITLNATTGELHEYSIEEVPEWVDRVQPESFVMQQINNQGEYVHGILNFSNQDKFKTSEGGVIVYNEGRNYLFTGLTSVGADESAIGFIMVDMVTKESKIYQMSGATETAAMKSAQGKVQQFGYYASQPIILNHEGVPTYFMTLKDNSGLIKQYAFVSVANVTSVGAGESINEALRDYNRVLGTSNSLVPNDGDKEEINGTISRVASENNGDILVYKFILTEVPNKIFVTSYDKSEELALSQIGDSVSIAYYESDKQTVEISSFDNLSIN